MTDATARAYAPECHGVYACAIYSDAECAAVLARARALDSWHQAEITIDDDHGASESITDASTRKARLMDGTRGAPILDEFEARVRREILPLIRDTWGIELDELAGTQLVQYQPGGHYETHQDGGGTYANRYFTVVCYLNADFEGGCTSFPTIPHVVRPETGKVVIFPSTYYHCAEAVSSGEKSVLITWVCGPVPIQWI